jgi:hypothetical protein
MERDPRRRSCPPYFNLGVLVASADAMQSLGERVYAEMDVVNRLHRTHLRCQVALTLAVTRTGIPWHELPLRLNFPNDLRFCRAAPNELRQAQIVHYLRWDEINRDTDFQGIEAVAVALERPLANPPNRLVQERLRLLHPRIAAEAA